MDHKDKESVQKWQMILQWICAAIWIAVVIIDLICGQKIFLTITQSIAALLFIVSAVVTTVRRRNSQSSGKEE